MLCIVLPPNRTITLFMVGNTHTQKSHYHFKEIFLKPPQSDTILYLLTLHPAGKCWRFVKSSVPLTRMDAIIGIKKRCWSHLFCNSQEGNQVAME